MVLHDQAAEVLHQGHQRDDFGVIAGRPQRLGHAGGAQGTLDPLFEVASGGGVERPGPVAQRQCAAAHAVQADHRDGAADRQNRAVTRHLGAAHRGAVHALEQFEGQCRIAQHHLGQLFRVLALHQRQAGGTRRGARQGRQRADLAHPLDQLPMRVAVLIAIGLEPTLERARQGAGVAVTLARLAVGGAVRDHAQRLGHGARQIPGQAQGVAAVRRQAGDDTRHIGLLQRRSTRQQAVHDDAQRQHVALGRAARLTQTLIDFEVGGRRRQPLGLVRRDLETEHADDAVVGHGQQERLDVVVRQPGVVSEGQAGQRLRHPTRDVSRRVALARRRAFGQGRAKSVVIGDKGPALLLAHFQHRRQVGMLQAGAAPGLLDPGRQRGRVGRLLARQHQQHHLPAAAVDSAPRHAVGTAPEQLAHLESAELAQGFFSGNGGVGGGHG